MKYTMADCLTWWFMSKQICRTLHRESPEWNMTLLKYRAKVQFKDILSDTDEIGSPLKNMLRLNLTGSMVWFAFYDADNSITEDGGTPDTRLSFSGGMDRRLYETMVNEFIAHTMRKGNADMLDPEQQKKFLHRYGKGLSVENEYNWKPSGLLSPI